MIFSSYAFVYAFLPVVVAGFYLLRRWGPPSARYVWLALGSLAFYGWWHPPYVVLILASVAFNHGCGHAVARARRGGRRGWARGLTAFGVSVDLGLLGYFKYAGFLALNLNALLRAELPIVEVVLPLGISFYTFQQIAYLVDVGRGKVVPGDALRFFVFVTFFPQLIAGPIVRYPEMMGQFARGARGSRVPFHLALGLTIFVVGLFKKTVIADAAGTVANPLFDAVAAGGALPASSAWLGAVAYYVQLYFDFSGYSDMAVGLAHLFGIRLPMNFDSPYQALGPIAFWRRWHMTLARFVNVYVFQPLALRLTRFAVGRGHAGLGLHLLSVVVPIFLTFLLVGLWHGAGWTFIAFGAIHGAALAANHLFRHLRRGSPGSRAGALASWVGTTAFLVTSFVTFRADSLEAARGYYRCLLGLGSAGGLAGEEALRFGLGSPQAWVLLGGLAIAWTLPNVYELTARYRPVFLLHAAGQRRSRLPLRWRPTLAWGLAVSGAAVWAVWAMTGGANEFLYFDF